MEEKLLNLVYELKDALKNDERIILLNKLEKEMENNEEVIILSRQKDECMDRYNDVLRFYNEDSKKAKESLKRLHEAKLALDMHPLVRQYLAAYKEVRELYEKINYDLFSSLNLKAVER